MSAKSPNILIVDDNVFNLQVTTEILKEQGYKIGLAQSGKEALMQIEVQAPDLILLDIMMPDMDGIETCMKIKENDELSDIPIIFLTAKSQTEDIVKAFKVGGVDYVTKPFQKEELIARVRSHIDLYHSKLKIKKLNATRDRLYSIIAHDIKTPFSNILFLVNAVKDGHATPGTEEFEEVIDQLEKNTASTNDLLNNLLTWTRYQSGIINPNYNVTDLNTLILETNQLLEPIALKKNIHTEFELKEECEAYADETTLKTIIRNLYSNAIKFSKPGKVIKITTRQENGSSQFIIKDRGVGMTQEVIDKIFNKKEAYTTIGTEEESGTGLGLQIVKDFVELNHGKLKVKSRPDEGTLFSISLHNKPF